MWQNASGFIPLQPRLSNLGRGILHVDSRPHVMSTVRTKYEHVTRMVRQSRALTPIAARGNKTEEQAEDARESDGIESK